MTFLGFSFPSASADTTAGPKNNSEPGTSSRTSALAPRAAAEAAMSRLPMPVGNEAAAVAEQLQQLSRIGHASATVALGVRGGSPAVGGAARLAELCGQALPRVLALAELEAARVAEPASAAQEGEQAHAWRMESARASLDMLALAILEVSTVAGPSAAAAKATNALTVLSGAAGPLGWHAAVDASTARERVTEQEPCASDPASGADARAENPEHCYLPEQARIDHRTHLQVALTKLGNYIHNAFMKYKQPLEAAIERDRKIGEAVSSAMLDAIVEAVTLGAGKVVLPAMHGAAAVGAAAATEAAKASAFAAVEAAREVAIDIVKGATKDAFKTVMKESGQADSAAPGADPRYKTVAQADSLAESTGSATDALTHDIVKLDDATLQILITMIESVTPAQITARLEKIMAAYRSQIEPLGEHSLGLDGLTVRTTVKRAIRVRLPNGRPPRYALVDYTSDVDPAVRAQGRAAYAGLRDIQRRLDGEHLFDELDRGRDRAWAATPDVDIEFQRWIENPSQGGLDLEAMVADDAIDVPYDHVRNLPLLVGAGVPGS